ncbi:LOB domain-containing protein 1 [Vitis vinifera]|uniref:LOB domain-containing protein 1 n=1 Tax=Vitis vinifera TaxID=29760 RepID=A0A438CGS6_VITVI|nr:LOB domain-containing protein 1 [Vitis vinifera]
MEYTHRTTATLGVSTAIFSASSSNSSPSPSSSLPTTVQGPCAACKILRRRCTERCVLAPYFPPTEPLKFVIAHKVFGASNIVKALQELPESKRADAVSSMVYEAYARNRDPVYGCAGAISHLQKQLNDLQAELAMTQAALLLIQCQQHEQNHENTAFFDQDKYFSSVLEPSWQ